MLMNPHINIEQALTSARVPVARKFDIRAVSLGRISGVFRIWMERSRQRRDLANLDIQGLNDVGISPYDARREINKPFWQK